MTRTGLAALGVLLLLRGAASAQVAPVQPPIVGTETEVEEVVVVARRIGVPVWRVARGEATVVLVGHIDRVPEGADWSPAELERAVSLADGVVFPATAQVSAADIGRVLFRARSILFLPKGKLLTDYISPELAARLERLRARGVLDDDYLRSHPQTVALALRRSIGVRVRGNRDAVDVIEAAAKKHRVPTEQVSVVQGRRLINDFLEQGPAAYVRCLETTVAAAEEGPAGVRRRLEDWSRSRVQAVLRSPVHRSLGGCGAGSPELARTLREQWRNALARKLARPGETVAVVPLLFLAERDGLLDRLEAEGAEVSGPRWRDPGADGERP